MNADDDERTADMANPAAEHADGLGRETADCIVSTVCFVKSSPTKSAL